MVTKKIFRTLVEAKAVKDEINKLNKKLGYKKRSKIRLTRNLKFEVY